MINLNRSMAWGAALVLGGLLAGGSAQGQATPPAQVQEEVLTIPGAPAAPAEVAAPRAEHEWHPFSSNSIRIYMADVQTIAIEGDVSRVQVAKPPLAGAAGDYSHAVEVVEFRCATKESRSTTEIQYGPDGTEEDRYDDPTAWESYRPESRDGYLAALVCDGQRSANHVPSVKAWVDAGRKSGG